jgi:hypothetical protein
MYFYLQNVFYKPLQRLIELVMGTFNIACSFPTDPIHIFLFTDVLNALELKSKLLAGDTEYLYAFIDADLVRVLWSTQS